MILTDQLRKEIETTRVILMIMERIGEKLDTGIQVHLEDRDEFVGPAEVLVQSPEVEHGGLALLLSEHREIRRSFEETRRSPVEYGVELQPMTDLPQTCLQCGGRVQVTKKEMLKTRERRMIG